MAHVLREHNLGHDGILTQIKTVLEENAPFYAGIDLKCVACLQNGKWRNALTIIRGIPKEIGLPVAKQALGYPNLKFLHKQFSADQTAPFLEGLKEKLLRFDNDTVELSQNYSSFNSYEFLPGENDYGPLAGYFYEAGKDSISFTQDPLIDYSSPFFASPYHAIRDWMEIKGFHLDRDGRLGSVLLFLPECRAGFTSISTESNSLKLTVSERAGSDLPLKVVGLLKTKIGDNAISEAIQNRALELSLPGALDSIELYLIGPSNTIYDYHREGPFHSSGHRRLLADQLPLQPDATSITRAIELGESETIEFKPFIDPGHPKFEELIETAIAFANTKGGMILLGVNNHCGIEGIEKGISHSATKTSKSQAEATATYTGTIRQKIAGAMNRMVPLRFSEQNIESHIIIAINIPEGQEKPYFRLQSKIAYIRRGANNVVADPEREIPALRNLPPGFSSLVGGKS